VTLTLVRAIPTGDGEIYAVWRDETADGSFEFAAIHDSSGRAAVANMGLRAPRLSREQLHLVRQAHQPVPEPAEGRHAAYDLADKLTAQDATWANRAQKAARLVETGAVTLTGPDTAVVKGDSDSYSVNGRICQCPWHEHHPDSPCSHYIAARMARALDQEITPDAEAEKERRSQARALAGREWQLARQVSGHQAIMQRERQARAQARLNGQNTAVVKRQALAELGIGGTA
jgi:hypothetical protein